MDTAQAKTAMGNGKHYKTDMGGIFVLTFEKFLSDAFGILYGDFLCMNRARQKEYEWYYKCYLNGDKQLWEDYLNGTPIENIMK